MPPPRPKSIPRTNFPAHLSKLKTTAYDDLPPSTRAFPPSHAIRTLAWSPLGSLVATGAADRTLRVWNPEKPNVRHSTELKGSGAAVERVVWHPRNESEVAGVCADGWVRFWDVRTKGIVGRCEVGEGAFTGAWRSEGDELVVGRKNDTLYRISRETCSIISTHPQTIQTNETAFSWPGKDLFLTCGDGTIKILDYPSMDLLHTMRGHTSSCYTIALSPKGTHVAVGGSDAITTLWDTTHLSSIHGLAAAAGPVRSVSFSFDGVYVIAGADESPGLDIAHVESGEYVHRIETGNVGAVPIVMWHPWRYAIAYAGDAGGLKILGGMGG